MDPKYQQNDHSNTPLISDEIRVDQALPSFSPYDAIGLENLAFRSLLRQRGFRSDIFAEQYPPGHEIRPLTDIHRVAKAKQVIIHHFSIGSTLPYILMDLPSLTVTRYHNITPAWFFPHPHENLVRSVCLQGRHQLPLLRSFSPSYWAASAYNAQELREHNFKDGCVLPVFRHYESLSTHPNCKKTSERLKADPRKTLLFVGRVIPNKAQHHLILLLSMYQRFVSKDIRLICVGGADSYFLRQLKSLCVDLDLQVTSSTRSLEKVDVLFVGQVTHAELASYYRHADAFVCLSDHEGFGVPLVEAMTFGLPILAHNAAAVPETVGEGGLIIDKHDPVASVEALHSLLTDAQVQNVYRRKSLSRANDFRWDKLSQRFDQCLANVLARI